VDAVGAHTHPVLKALGEVLKQTSIRPTGRNTYRGEAGGPEAHKLDLAMA